MTGMGDGDSGRWYVALIYTKSITLTKNVIAVAFCADWSLMPHTL